MRNPNMKSVTDDTSIPPVPNKPLIKKPKCEDPFTSSNENNPDGDDMKDIAASMIGKTSFSQFVHNNTNRNVWPSEQSSSSSLTSSVQESTYNDDGTTTRSERIMEALPVTTDIHDNTNSGSGDQTGRPWNPITTTMHNEAISYYDDTLTHVMTRNQSRQGMNPRGHHPNENSLPDYENSTTNNQNNTLFQYWPDDAIQIISTITSMPSRPVTESKLSFKLTLKDAIHNWTFIQKFDNLGEALDHDDSSFTKYGSEFRTPETLEPLLKLHPLWQKLKSILHNGVIFPLKPLDVTTQRKDLDSALNFGNHKGVDKNLTFYDKLNSTDVSCGYSIPIPLDSIKLIPGASICPMNVIEQFTISENGELTEKQRACHDLSFPFAPSDTSVNSRVSKDELNNCVFGHCILRIIHYIISLRLRHPSIPIYIQKVDWKSAYRRIHMNWTTCIQCCSVYKEFALIPLRAVFGGSPCPSDWSVLSETTADLANFLLSNHDWDPSTTHSPLQHMIQQPISPDPTLPLTKALPIMLTIPPE